MNRAISLTAVVACSFAVSPLAAQTRPAPTRTAAPAAETARIRALRSAFEATRPFEVNQTSMQQLVAQRVTLPSRLTPAQAAQMQQIGQLARKGVSPSLQQSWASLVAGLSGETTATDVNALVQWVLLEPYLDNVEDLRFCAEKVKFFNDLKSSMRSEIQRARGVPLATRTPSSAKVEQYVKQLEDRLNSVGDDAQLANLDLQNARQKQQSILQTIGAISKMCHDTAMATVRKMGG